MPRPKRPGAPEPKKRSRNGCWPCKARKVKCDEAHPTCLNCQRQDEACDYSVRLNWDGRGKRKTEPVEEGQINFTANNFMAGLDVHVQRKSGPLDKEPAHPQIGTYQYKATTAVEEGHQSFLAAQNNDEDHSKTTSCLLTPTYAAYGRPHSSQLQLLAQPDKESIMDMSIIDPSIMTRNSPSSDMFWSIPYEPTGQLNDQRFSQSYDRYRDDSYRSNFLPVNTGQAQQPAISRLRRSPMRSAGLESPSDSGLESPTSGSFIEFTTGMPFERPPKRFRHGFSTQECNSPGPTEMPPPTVLSNAYGTSVCASPQTSMTPGSGQALTPAASSSQSDDGYKNLLSKPSPLTSHDTHNSDPRRLSVESLLSGPPGIFNHNPPYAASLKSREHTPLPYGDPRDDMETWGVDRGFKDFDIGKNDDANSISGNSPAALREHLELVRIADDDYVPNEFGFGVQAKDIVFEKGGYYASPVLIKFPRSFQPLPSILMENPMNLLYFHHFISHTARILVPHHCSSNPFQKILPQMALQDPDLMNLLLAFSASHRARLLQQPEPATRIALWVRDIFSNLRHALDDPSKIVSDSSLAAAIMLASLEIISPKAFGVEVPWQQHLDVARQMIAARGGANSMRDSSAGSYFLLRWFAYLDVLGRLIGGHQELPSITMSATVYDTDENGYQIDCMLGFTSRCVSILAKIADLAALCATERLDEDHNVRPEWEPTEEIRQQAEQLIEDLDNARTSALIQHCPHLQSSEEATYQWDNREMAATNEAFHWAGLVHLHRRVLGKASTDVDVQTAVREIVSLLYKVRKGSSAEACLLFPMFTAGCDAQDKKQRALIMDRMKGVEDFGMSQVSKARRLMQKVWDTGKPWETLVSGEFVG